jgi:hypothetical protein
MNRCDVITFYGVSERFDKLSLLSSDQNRGSCDKNELTIRRRNESDAKSDELSMHSR